MNTATTTAPNATDSTFAEKQAAIISYQLRCTLTSLDQIQRQTSDFTTFELTTAALKLSTELRAIARVTADQNLILTIADIQDELQEIFPAQNPSREKMLLSLSIIRSMIAETLPAD